MRIVVVGSGLSVHVLSRSAALAKRGHEVRLVTLGPTLPAEQIEVRTRPIPRSVFQAVRSAISFLADIRSFQPDLLHLHYAGGKLATLATLSRVRPKVVTVMGGDVLFEQRPGGVSWLERRATRRVLEESDWILVKSEALRAAVDALGKFDAEIETVRWGVDLAMFYRDPAAAESLRARLGLGALDRVILSPRILSPLYNTHLIIEAMGRVCAEVPRALLLVTEYRADPEFRAELRALAARLRLGDRVRWVGEFSHAEMNALYSLSEAVVFVPSSDGLPQSLFEAMACEVPVIAARHPSLTEVVTEGETVVFVDLNTQSIAAGLVRVLSDPASHASLARRALKTVREVAVLPREVERVERGFLQLVGRPAPRRGLPLLLDALGLFLR